MRTTCAVCFALAAAFWLCEGGLPAAGAPTIHVSQTSVGFGSVPDDRPIEHSFAISNRGDTVLSIDRITEDCGGCLSYSIDTNAIAPGRTATIEVTLDTGVLEGNVAKNLVLHTNDPDTPVLLLSLWGKVSPPYKVRPRSVFFDAVARTASVSQMVHIAESTRSMERLLSVSSSTGCFTGELSAGAEPGTYELRVGTVPPLPEGMTRGEIVLSGTNRAGPRCVIRVAAYVPHVFGVLPDKLLLKAIDEEQSKIVFLRQNSARPAKLLDVVLPSPGFTCEINTGPGPADYRIYVRARGLAGSRGLTARLILRTDDPARTEVVVPVEVR